MYRLKIQFYKILKIEKFRKNNLETKLTKINSTNRLQMNITYTIIKMKKKYKI